jgi:hypothetical protein
MMGSNWTQSEERSERGALVHEAGNLRSARSDTQISKSVAQNSVFFHFKGGARKFSRSLKIFSLILVYDIQSQPYIRRVYSKQEANVLIILLIFLQFKTRCLPRPRKQFLPLPVKTHSVETFPNEQYREARIREMKQLMYVHIFIVHWWKSFTPQRLRDFCRIFLEKQTCWFLTYAYHVPNGPCRLTLQPQRHTLAGILAGTMKAPLGAVRLTLGAVEA